MVFLFIPVHFFAHSKERVGEGHSVVCKWIEKARQPLSFMSLFPATSCFRLLFSYHGRAVR